MIFSLSGSKQKAKKTSGVTKTSISDIHSIDLLSTKYKKAV
ncbi:MAG: hypothetical protein AB8B59_02975 [Maribacter sp.]